MRKRLRQAVFCVLAGLLTVGCLSGTVCADEPYEVYQYDVWGEAIPSQAGYLADRAVSGADLGVGHFNDPNDLFRDRENRFFIADTGNNRIVVADTNFTRAVAVIDTFRMPDGTTATLNGPKGIYVSPQTGLLYIADTGNARVLVSDEKGYVRQSIEKPDSALYAQESTFLPQKVLVDKAGNVYVVLNNTTNGACVFRPDGSFSGYYGANRVEATKEVVLQYFWRSIATEEMQAKMKKSVASAFTNFDLDDEGFIFTSTESATQRTDRVKKVNPAGENIFANYDVCWGDYTAAWYSGTNYVTRITDIDIGDNGTINCLDLTTGRVFQYDEEARLLFIVGTIADQTGGFKRPTAVESMDNRLYVLDGDKASVTIFGETAFGAIVHKAVGLYNEGRYEEALEPWRAVLKYDGNYLCAYAGIASALFRQGDYRGSMRYAKRADASYLYNRAFEGWRSEFVRENYPWLLGGVVLVIAAPTAWRRLRKKRRGAECKQEGHAQ